ncbi:GIY-YIG nuclease family protein [Halosimplex sp. J119]
MTGSTAEGTYTLVLELGAPATIEVGALGAREFDAGWYAYTGSAFGPGGFTRVERHRELCAGERDARHWHVDYLLGHPDVTVEAVGRTPDEDVECEVSRTLAGEQSGGDGDDAEARERVPAFGASDCDCDSHLVSAVDGASLRRAVERVHRKYR